MRIGSSSSRDLDNKQLLSDRVKKQHIIDDVFNNRAPKKGDVGGVKLRLSHLSQVLEHKFRVKLDKVLSENQPLKDAVDKISIEEGEHTLDPGVKQARQIRLYHHWLSREGEGEGSNQLKLGEGSFQFVKESDPTGEIEKLIDEQNEHKDRLADEVKQSAASYYYLVYPETYSFN